MIVLENHTKKTIKAAVFDFDGTISTIRCGWEEVMEPLMLSYLSVKTGETEELRKTVRDYIDKSTGIQTILQMKWLAEQAVLADPDASNDPWSYKSEYNKLLMQKIESRIRDAEAGNKESYLIYGSVCFLSRLHDMGIRMFAASGTDVADVRHESAALGVDHFFDRIEGAMPMSESCSKEATLRSLISESGFAPENIIVIGDGPVEIKLGREFGTLTLGIASDEQKRIGYNERKIERLKAAKAHAITDSFAAADEILAFM